MSVPIDWNALSEYVDSRVHKINEHEDSKRLDGNRARSMVYELLRLKAHFEPDAVEDLEVDGG